MNVSLMFVFSGNFKFETGLFPTPFCLFFLYAAPKQKMRARVTRDGTISAKNSTFGYFDKTNPITGKGIQLQSPTW